MMGYIINYTYFIYAFYNHVNNYSPKNVEYLKKCTKRCGAMAIKLLQFIQMFDPQLLKDFNYVFEENCVHDFEYTFDTYHKEYSRNIFDDYRFDYTTEVVYKDFNVVGSGSIGQVYKAFCKKRNEYVAIKVKHPNINKVVKKTVIAINFVCFICKYFNKFHYVMMEFVKNIKLQIDYHQEEKNTITLKEKFKEESRLIVPEVYSYSDSFIIMSYHSGKSYSDVSPDLQLLTSVYLQFIHLTSCIIHNFIHVDLHIGNWKIHEENNDIKIIIYDCGLMFSSNDINTNVKLIEAVYNRKNIINLLDIVEVKDCKNKRLFKKYVDGLLEIEELSASNFFRKFILKGIDLGLLKDTNILNILISVVILGDISRKSCEIFTKYLRSNSTSNTNLFHSYIGFFERCGYFNQLKQHFINELTPVDAQIYSDWLFDQFGHRKGDILNNIIYSKIYKAFLTV